MQGVLTHHDHVFAKTHAIERLVSARSGTNAELSEILHPAGRFTEYAWRFRCPGPVAGPELQEVEEALGVARAVVRAGENAGAGAC